MNTQTTVRRTEVRTNILGVTGLSRAVLADLFRRRGLFGRDSRLSDAEQAVIENRLPAIDGIARRPTIRLQTPALKALADVVDTLLAAGDATESRHRAQAAGLSSAALTEAAITVDNLRVVFGPFPATPAAAAPQVTVPYARSA